MICWCAFECRKKYFLPMFPIYHWENYQQLQDVVKAVIIQFLGFGLCWYLLRVLHNYSHCNARSALRCKLLFLMLTLDEFISVTNELITTLKFQFTYQLESCKLSNFKTAHEEFLWFRWKFFDMTFFHREKLFSKLLTCLFMFVHVCRGK